MAHAEICPICEGAGKVPDATSATTGGGIVIPQLKTCHGCGGPGWIEIKDDCPVPWPLPERDPRREEPEWPYYPYITYIGAPLTVTF